jgi:hypothetical protein
VLSSHVDRLPLVSSAIICVDADVEEPWPLEVIGHDGKAHNVTMEPGDMVLCKWVTKAFNNSRKQRCCSSDIPANSLSCIR